MRRIRRGHVLTAAVAVALCIPASGRSKPAIRRSVVVLPEPDGPSMVKNSPRRTSRSTESTATTSPYVFRIETSATSTALSGAASTAPAARSSAAVRGLATGSRILRPLVLGHDQPLPLCRLGLVT